MTVPAPLAGILETALYIDDLGEARDFYGRVLGLPEVAAVAGRHVFFRCGNAMVLLFVAGKTVKPSNNPKMPVPAHGAVGDGHMCFRANADELVRWVVHLRKNNVAIEADFQWPNGARSVYVRDPSGNSIEFAEPQLWGFTE